MPLDVLRVINWFPMLATLVAFNIGVVVSCVPSQPSDSTPESVSPTPSNKPKARPPSESTTEVTDSARSRVIDSQFEDRFDRSAIGEDWYRLGNAWSITGGRLCGKGARNKGIWLRRRLPTNARIEFDAVSDSAEGDIKAEFWGDGASGATAASYSNATSYLTIFGGWKNTLHVLARIDEHGSDRLEVRTNTESDVEREQPVVAGRIYRFRIERSDGKTVSWWVDDQLIHRFEDPEPLVGQGHEFFGFNNWLVPVCFDNLTITPL